MGRYMAIMSPPINMPRIDIIMGSMSELIDSTAFDLATVNKATIATEVIDSIALSSAGVITVNMAGVGGFDTADTIVLTPVFTAGAGYDWDCTSAAADDAQLPPDCVGQ